jgi:hypothetical protein
MPALEIIDLMVGVTDDHGVEAFLVFQVSHAKERQKSFACSAKLKLNFGDIFNT